MRKIRIFWDYLTYDSDGYVVGIEEDAPESMKKLYEKYVERLEGNPFVKVKLL